MAGKNITLEKGWNDLRDHYATGNLLITRRQDHDHILISSEATADLAEENNIPLTGWEKGNKAIITEDGDGAWVKARGNDRVTINVQEIL